MLCVVYALSVIIPMCLSDLSLFIVQITLTFVYLASRINNFFLRTIEHEVCVLYVVSDVRRVWLWMSTGWGVQGSSVRDIVGVFLHHCKDGLINKLTECIKQWIL